MVQSTSSISPTWVRGPAYTPSPCPPPSSSPGRCAGSSTDHCIRMRHHQQRPPSVNGVQSTEGLFGTKKWFENDTTIDKYRDDTLSARYLPQRRASPDQPGHPMYFRFIRGPPTRQQPQTQTTQPASAECLDHRASFTTKFKPQQGVSAEYLDHRASFTTKFKPHKACQPNFWTTAQVSPPNSNHNKTVLGHRGPWCGPPPEIQTTQGVSAECLDHRANFSS